MNRVVLGSLLALLLVAGALWWALQPGEPPPRQPSRPEPAPVAEPLAERPRPRETDEPAVPRPAPRPHPSRAAGGPRDPLDVVFAGTPAVAGVVELSTLRDSTLGHRIYQCLRSRLEPELEEMDQKIGLDPLRQIERFAFADQTAMLQGDFAGVRWGEIDHPRLAQPHGDHATLYLNTVAGSDAPAPEPDGEVIAVWRDKVVLVGRGREGVEAALDRLDGKAPAPASPLPQDTGADIRGVLPLAELIDVLPLSWDVREPIKTMLTETGGGAAYDVFVDENLRARVRIPLGGERGREVADALEAAVSAFREGAVPEGVNTDAMHLWDGLKIQRDEDGLSVELPISGDTILAAMPCGDTPSD